MEKPTYFSRIQYTAGRVGGQKKFCVVLDLNRGEITYQITERTRTLYSCNKQLSKGLMHQILLLCKCCVFEEYLSKKVQTHEEWGVNPGAIGY